VESEAAGQPVKRGTIRTGLGSDRLYLTDMFKRQTPEEATARRAYQARCQHIRSGAIPGLLERDSKVIRPEIRAIIDEALAKRVHVRAKA
jgi:hypothetical protein